MQRLEVSGAVRLTYKSLGVKGLSKLFTGTTTHIFLLQFTSMTELNLINATAEAGFLTLLFRTKTPNTRGIPTGRKQRAKVSVSVVPSNCE